MLRFGRSLALPLTVGAAVLALALPSGGYGVTARSLTAILVWWVVILVVALRFAPADVSPAARVAVAALAGLALDAGLSIAWSWNAERAFAELDRALLYLGIFVAALLLVRPVHQRSWARGLGGGIAVVALVALGSRLLPGLVPADSLSSLLPGAQTRLSYPLEYWNGLGIFTAIGVPLLLAAAVDDGPLWGRGLALAPLPAMGAAVYLTSSRGAFVVLGTGIIVHLALARRRVAAAVATLIAAAGGAGAVLVLQARPELVDGPVRSAAARADGPTAAVLIVVICLLAGLLQAAVSRAGLQTLRAPPRVARVGVVLIALVVLVAGAGVADPVGWWHTFKQPPSQFLHAQPGFVRTHLLSGGGSGRWQFWSAAVSEFRSAPIFGRGAGSYAEWWTQHASISYSVRNAHSQYLETLGDLGLIGGALLVTALAGGVWAGVARIRALGEDRTTAAGVLAAFVAFCLGAGIDWIWQITVAGAVGIALLALLVGSAARSGTQAPAGPRTGRNGLTVSVAAAVGLAVMAAEALPWLVQVEVQASQRAVTHGDLLGARRAALAGRELEPWAASPYLQLALVSEQLADLGDAHQRILEAIRRDPHNWQLRLVAARIAVKGGSIPEARSDLAAARRLAPRSPLFAPVARPQ